METVIDTIETAYLRRVQLHWSAYCSKMSLITVRDRQLSQAELLEMVTCLRAWISCFAQYDEIAQKLAHVERGQLWSNLSEIKKAIDSTLRVYSTMLNDGITRDDNLRKLIQPGLGEAAEKIRQLLQPDTPLLATLQVDNERISGAILAFRNDS
jgi:hypothetical protein